MVSLREQKLDVYRGTGLVISSKVSSGKRGYDTKAGVFSILEKQRYHHSNLFSGAPMPWMQRLTWSGTALHAGIVPGYPASHGCVRLPFSFAPKLFQITTLGENVVVTGDRVAPQLIKHENLFQPAAPSRGGRCGVLGPGRIGELELSPRRRRPKIPSKAQARLNLVCNPLRLRLCESW